MQTISALFVGALLGAGLIFLSVRLGAGRSRYFFAAGLTVVAAIYAAFSLNAGPAEWVLIELAGVALFTLLSVAGYRRSLVILAAGWTLHVGWDALHEVVEPIRFIPSWYPSMCIAFDMVVGAYLFVEWRKERQQAKS